MKDLLTAAAPGALMNVGVNVDLAPSAFSSLKTGFVSNFLVWIHPTRRRPEVLWVQSCKGYFTDQTGSILWGFSATADWDAWTISVMVIKASRNPGGPSDLPA